MKKMILGFILVFISRISFAAYTPNVSAGTIITFAGTTCPAGFLATAGAAISRSTYAGLFTAISTTWGVGNGTTTFNVPDLRGMFLRGTGTHGTLTMANTNAFAGAAVGASENDQFQQWQAGFDADATGARDYYGHSGGRDTSNVATEGAGANFTPVRAATNAQGIRPLKAKSDGTYGTPRQGDETRPVSYSITYCIKY